LLDRGLVVAVAMVGANVRHKQTRMVPTASLFTSRLLGAIDLRSGPILSSSPGGRESTRQLDHAMKSP
jgi:hypothetical protein